MTREIRGGGLTGFSDCKNLQMPAPYHCKFWMLPSSRTVNLQYKLDSCMKKRFSSHSLLFHVLASNLFFRPITPKTFQYRNKSHYIESHYAESHYAEWDSRKYFSV